MSWVKVDDQMTRHPKWLSLGKDRLPCQGLWLDGMCYASGYLTDGLVPDAAIPPGAQKLAERLVEAGLWDRTEDGYEIHDYHDYQPTRAEVLERRAARSAAGQLGGRRSAQRRSKTQATGQASAQANAIANAQAPAQALATQLLETPSKQNATPARPVPVGIPSTQPERVSSAREADTAGPALSPVEAAMSRLIRRSPAPRQLTVVEELVDELPAGVGMAVIENLIDEPPERDRVGVLLSQLREAKDAMRPRNGAGNGQRIGPPRSANRYDALIDDGGSA